MPLLKLSTLLIKTLSKPMAKSLKSRISDHPMLTSYCITLGQQVHKFWSTVTIRAAGHVGIRVKPLEETAALNQGAEFVAEAFIFTVAGVCVVVEMTLSDAKKSRDSEAKKRKEKQKEDSLQATFDRLNKRLSSIEATHELLIQEYESSIAKLEEEKNTREHNAPQKVSGFWSLFLR